MTLVTTVGRVGEVGVVERFYCLLAEGAPEVLKAA